MSLDNDAVMDEIHKLRQEDLPQIRQDIALILQRQQQQEANAERLERIEQQAEKNSTWRSVFQAALTAIGAAIGFLAKRIFS